MSLKSYLYYSLPKYKIIEFHQTNKNKTYKTAKYVCGYLYGKCLMQHTYNLCIEYGRV